VATGEQVALELELPVGERRERLLQALSRVIALRGYEPFVCAPILLPSREFFPEAAERSLEGAGILVLRLLRYARLTPLRVRLTGFRERSRRVAEGLSLHDPELQTAAWYAGVEDGVCRFGLELGGLRDDAALIAALAHEVSHAYRDRYALAVRDREIEEKLTDLTAVFLGFGAFLLNASHRVDSGGYAATGERLLFQRHSLGYLSPAEFALLLAAQVAVRGLDRRTRRPIRDALGPNHARLFEFGVEAFSEDVEGLRRQLGVPEPGEWAPIWTAAAEELDLGELEVVHPAPASAVSGGGGAIAFRVVQSQAAWYGVLSLFTCLALGTALDLSGNAWLGLFALGLFVGGVWGQRRKVYACSACRGRLSLGDSRCQKCSARLVGDIRSFEERLAAEESFRALDRQSEPQPVDGASRDSEPADRAKDLVQALFWAWVLTTGLDRPPHTEAVAALIADIQLGKIDIASLTAARRSKPHPFSTEAIAFATYYLAEKRLVWKDVEILRTAHVLGANRSSLQRYSALLDRRLAEWRARGQGAPVHAT